MKQLEKFSTNFNKTLQLQKFFTANDFHYMVGGLVVSSVAFCELIDRINDQRTTYGSEDKYSLKQQIHD